MLISELHLKGPGLGLGVTGVGGGHLGSLAMLVALASPYHALNLANLTTELAFEPGGRILFRQEMMHIEEQVFIISVYGCKSQF